MRRVYALAVWTGGPPPFDLRADMAAQFEAEGRRLPVGRTWALLRDCEVIALGGLEPAGAAEARGWLLTADLDVRDWAMACWATRQALDEARTWRTIRRVRVLADGARRRAAAMMERLGFEWTGGEGRDRVMTLELN